MLFLGERVVYNSHNDIIQLASMFGFVKNVDGAMAVANRIFEAVLYNLFLSEEEVSNRTFSAAGKCGLQCGESHETFVPACREISGSTVCIRTKMAAFHGELELLYQPEYAWLWQEGHIRHYHVNDYGGGYMEWGKLKTLPIGAGHVDFEKFFAFVRGTGYQGTFTVEATAFDRMGVEQVLYGNQIGHARKGGSACHLRLV